MIITFEKRSRCKIEHLAYVKIKYESYTQLNKNSLLVNEFANLAVDLLIININLTG